MKIKRAVLENALSKVKPGLEKGKEYIEQMKHVLFDGEDIATYNDHIAILVPFETDFKTSVKFEDLYLNYSDTVDDIFNFIGIKNKDLKKSECYFKPLESASNIGLWRDCSLVENISIKYIEKELAGWSV